MATGFLFIRACVDTGGQQQFRQALPVWFLEEELPAYRFALGHIGRYGRIPTLNTMREEGFNLPTAREPPEFYATRLRDRAITTQVQQHFPTLNNAIKRMDTNALLGAIAAMSRATSAVAPSQGLTSFADQANLVLDAHDYARQRVGLLGVTLGWEAFDLLTDGGQPGDVIVLVGRPGLGKSYLMLEQVKRAWLAGSSVFIASMEMSAMQIARRLLGMYGQVNPSLLRSGRLSTQSYQQICHTVDGLDNMPPIHIMTGNFRKSVQDVNRAAMDLAPDALYIDAGYLLTPTKQAKTRREAIADVIEELKQVSIDRNIPLFTTVQFNRQVKRKQRGVPELNDIAESDVIAQVASIVIGVRYGVVPFERATRILSMIKNREGDEIELLINFALNPPNFDFIRIHVEGEDEEVQPQDMTSMADSGVITI